MRNSTARAIFWAWLVAGCLDISSAIVIWMMRDVRITRGFRGIATGLLGREAAITNGGTGVAMLGLALHFFIMLGWTMVFYLASRGAPALIRRPLPSGIAFGVLVYLIMYWVVVPLSRIGPRPHSFNLSATSDLAAILIHICLIGLPIALILSRLLPRPAQNNV